MENQINQLNLTIQNINKSDDFGNDSYGDFEVLIPGFHRVFKVKVDSSDLGREITINGEAIEDLNHTIIGDFLFGIVDQIIISHKILPDYDEDC